MSAAASLTASGSVTSLPLICGLLGGSLRSKPPIARPQPFLRIFSVPSLFSISRSSHSMPQNGQATFSNTLCISRSPVALRALEFCMPLEPHHKAREESTGGTATQLQGRNLSPLAVAQIGQDLKLPCPPGRPARHRRRPRLCCGQRLEQPREETMPTGDGSSANILGILLIFVLVAANGFCRRRICPGGGAAEPRGATCRGGTDKSEGAEKGDRQSRRLSCGNPTRHHHLVAGARLDRRAGAGPPDRAAARRPRLVRGRRLPRHRGGDCLHHHHRAAHRARRARTEKSCVATKRGHRAPRDRAAAPVPVSVQAGDRHPQRPRQSGAAGSLASVRPRQRNRCIRRKSSSF